MIEIEQIITFLGWCTVINMGILAFAAICIFTFKSFTLDVHSQLSGISPDKLQTLYFSYIANYKIFIFMFNFVPYIALKLMN